MESLVEEIKSYVKEHIHQPITLNEIAPRFQFAPMGWRGYIEGRPVRKLE